MSKKIKVELYSGGIRNLLKSDELKQACQTQADAVMARAGGGYEAEAHLSDQRVIVNVWPESAKARRENSKNNTLLKSLRNG